MAGAGHLVLAPSVQAAEEPWRTELRGAITPDRAWWDLDHYHLDIDVDVDTKTISGTNTMRYKVLSDGQRLQVELQAPMMFMRAEQNGKRLKVIKKDYSYFIYPDGEQKVGETYEIKMIFEGTPIIPNNPPWDAGITWTTDSSGKPFIANSNQDQGASVWWPNKDHGYDEPDSGMDISVEVPDDLMDVSNGQLVKVEEHKDRGTKTWHWRMKNPPNNYGVNLSIGDYVHFSEKYEGEDGTLDMDYYVLRENLDKAKTHFADARRTIEAFEHWFGPYPFYEDGFKLVEVPYLGMEHQSAVTYGNKYLMGYKGRDLSDTGWGLKWDFIIIHETGHEWFANNITAKDIADLWIHESFTNYSEGLYTEYHFGKEAGAEYVRGTRLGISNDKPIIGQYGRHEKGSKDMYPKGGNMLHTIRQLVDCDDLWRSILRGLNKTFHNQTVTSAEIESYMNDRSPVELGKVFDQYLRYDRVPTLEYYFKEGTLLVRWTDVVPGFDMPVKAVVNGAEVWLKPTENWAAVSFEQPASTLAVDPDFYVRSSNILGN
ncbi:peptidase M1 [Kordiimonas sediminis]|uniref:Peptidase M1 n=2 Tax=Kordiimonas sediminis TaxID=1735581 RepID=A0A919E6Z5_9PROT|nr:peptidase M1 [Kordiimonas sediminis]